MQQAMRRLIKADGTETELGRMTVEQLRQLLGADSLATVNLRDAFGHVMLLDDLGHDKQLPVNEKATQLYWAVCRVGTVHQIRGDVVVVPDADFGE